MQADAILLDDDVWVREAWELAAAKGSWKVITVATPAELTAVLRSQTPETPVFVDVELADGVSGAELAREVHASGFRLVFLATGHDPREFAGHAYLSGVIGKEPPAWLAEGRRPSTKLTAAERRALRAAMTPEQAAGLARRLVAYENALYGLDGAAWLDGVGVYYPEAVLDAWERALYESVSDEVLKQRTDAAWRAALRPAGA